MSFPENEVEVCREYIATNKDEIASLKIQLVTAELNRGIADFIQERVPFFPFAPINQSATKRNNARKLLRGFLERSDGTDKVVQKAIDSLHKVYTQLGGHAFDDAVTNLETFKAIKFSHAGITVADIEEAFGQDDIIFEEVFGPPEEPLSKFHTLEGYNGPVLDAQELVATHELLTGGPERDFRAGLLEAEINFGKGDFDKALEFYRSDSMIAATAPGGSPRRKFLAIRTGFAFLGLGDLIFRKSRNGGDDLSAAITAYNSAIKVLEDNEISLENELAKEIVDYATQQKSKIEGGFNFLGLSDGLVPIETIEFLEERMDDHLDFATKGAVNFERYLDKAQQLQDVEAELLAELTVAEQQEDIAAERIQIAIHEHDDIKNALAAISDKQDFLTAEVVKFGIETLIKVFAAAGASGGGGGGEGGGGGGGGGGEGGGQALSMDGSSSKVLSFLARANELSHQKTSAQLQLKIALNELAISMLEQNIVVLRRNFINDKLKSTGGRDLNKDLYYKLASFFAQLTERHTMIALRFAYLLERAIAFKFHKPNLPSKIPHFDFKSTAEGIISGPIKLQDITIAIKDEKKPPDQTDTFTLDYRLSVKYPIEYSLFQQTGRMQFPISLYDLDKERPGTHDRRILAFAVIPSNATPGYRGTLTHPGTFLERDRASTLDQSTKRFIPTDEDLAKAFAGLQDGKIPGKPVGGLIPFQLDADIKQLSELETEDLTEGPEGPTVKLFQRYGAATLWTLELTNVDTRIIKDVRFQLKLETLKTDPTLRTRLEDELIPQYEAELATQNSLDTAYDKITQISMAGDFREEFFQLETGETSIVLEEKHFPVGLTELKVKTVIAQAIDFNLNGAGGVHLTFSKDGFPPFEMTTVANGFSENLSADKPFLEPGERFEVLGTWRIRLTDEKFEELDPDQFNEVFVGDNVLKMGDLKFFVVYEFKEI